MEVGGTRRTLRLLTVATAFLSTIAIAPMADAAETPIRSPIVADDVPDPELLHDAATGRWHLYGTNGSHGNLPHRTSSDLRSWSGPNDALPSLGTWARQGFTWAPGIVEIDGTWALYYTANDVASGRQCIGHATATSPAGPFVDAASEPLVCQSHLGGSIDASPFVDTDGSLWLHWKSDENAIGGVSRLWSQQLTPAGDALVGTRRALLRFDRSWEHPLVEQPEMVHGPGGYTMFYAGGYWESAGYAIGYATCSGPAGPCTKRTTSAPWVTGDGGVTGPGGLSLATAPNGDVFGAFHGWRGAVGYRAGGRRSAHLEPVILRPDGPSLRSDLPRGAPTATLPPGLVTATGDFDGDGHDDLIAVDHGKRRDTLYWGGPGGDLRAEPLDDLGRTTPLTGDFDGDGRDDIFFYVPGAAGDSIWWGRSNRRFHVSRSAVGGVYRPITGDFNGDRIDDIFWYGPGNKLDYLWTGRRNRTFGTIGRRVLGTYRPLVGDFDANGVDDVFWYAPGTAADYVWWGAGFGWYTSVRTSVRGSYQPMTGDLDGNGSSDIFWYAPGGAADYLWSGRANRTFGSFPTRVLGSYDPVVGNFDGDRRDDVLWRSRDGAPSPYWHGRPYLRFVHSWVTVR